MERDKREKIKSEEERGDREMMKIERAVCPVSELRLSIMCWNFPSKKRTEPKRRQQTRLNNLELGIIYGTTRHQQEMEFYTGSVAMRAAGLSREVWRSCRLLRQTSLHEALLPAHKSSNALQLQSIV
jgi:hypothetical protein